MSDNLKIINNDEIDYNALVLFLFKSKNKIFLIISIIVFISIIYSLLVTPLYKSTITMYPNKEESSSTLSNFQGMASSFGINLGNNNQSFYIPDIIHSRLLKTKLIYHKWKSPKFNDSVNLINYWHIDDQSRNFLNPLNIINIFFKSKSDDDFLVFEQKALLKLSERIFVKTDKNGLIVVNVFMEDPQISAEIANYIYEAVIQITQSNYNKTAKMNLEFIQKRQNEVSKSLSSSENNLKEFRVQNRQISDSPILQLELERLMREVEIQTQVFITLQQQFELAKIEEVKEKPSVIVLDKAFPSIYKDSPKRKLIVSVAFIIGIIISIVYVLIVEVFKIRKR